MQMGTLLWPKGQQQSVGRGFAGNREEEELSKELGVPSTALLGEGAGEEPDEGDGGSHGRRGPAADAVGEDADDGRAEKNHPHGQGANPR